MDGPRQSNAFFRPLAVCSTSSGELYVADSGNHRIRFVNKYGYVTTHAGEGRRGMKNGRVDQAQFDRPSGICRSSQGHLLISDSGNHMIRIAMTNGTVKTYAGTGEIGTKDGAAMEATFNAPMDLCIDYQGQLYICDTGNHRIRMITSSRIVNTVTGSTVGYKDGARDEALFHSPSSARLTPTRLGTLLIADTGNHCIRLLNNGYVTTFAGRNESGFHVAGGKRSEVLFNSPISLTVSSDESVYVSDSGNHCIYHIPPNNGPVSVLSGGTPGCQDGSKEQAAFKRPGGICLVGQRQLILAETGHGRILVVKPDGSVANFAGRSRSGTVDGAVNKSTFFKPQALFSASSNDLLVADTMSNKIRRIRNGTVTTFAGSPERGCGNGRKDLANFDSPTGICISPANVVYIADTNNHVIRHITDGTAFTFAGTSGIRGFADGPGSVAKFNAPIGLILIPSALIVADSQNHRIRLIAKDSNVSTFAGTGEKGLQDGPAAKFNTPTELAYSSSEGLIYVSDHGNHAIRIIKIADGTVRTLAGLNGIPGNIDGPRVSALLNEPRGLALTPDGGLLVADTGNRSVRLINRADGSVTTFIESDLIPTVLPLSSTAQSDSISSSMTASTSTLLSGSTGSASSPLVRRPTPNPESQTLASSSSSSSAMDISEPEPIEPPSNLRTSSGKPSATLENLGTVHRDPHNGSPHHHHENGEEESSIGDDDVDEDEEEEPEQIPVALSLTHSGVLFLADVLRNQILYLPCPQWDQTRQWPKAKDFVQFYSFVELSNAPVETFDFQLTHRASGTVFSLHRFFVHARCPSLLTPETIALVESVESVDAVSNVIRLLYSDHFTPITSLAQVHSACQLAFICNAVAKPAWVALVKYHISDFFAEQLANAKRRLKNRPSSAVLKDSTHSQSMQAPSTPGKDEKSHSLPPPSTTSIDVQSEFQSIVNDCIEVLLQLRLVLTGRSEDGKMIEKTTLEFSIVDPVGLLDLILTHIKSFSKGPSNPPRSRSASISLAPGETMTSDTPPPPAVTSPSMISFKLPKHSASSSNSNSANGSSTSPGHGNRPSSPMSSHGGHSTPDGITPNSSPRSSASEAVAPPVATVAHMYFSPDFSRLSVHPEYHTHILEKFANCANISFGDLNPIGGRETPSLANGLHAYSMEHTLTNDMSNLYEKCKQASLMANVGGSKLNSSSQGKDFSAPDFVIQCGTARFACHKMVLYARWSHFAEMVKAGRVHTKSEELILPEGPLTPAIVSALLRYLYTNEVSHFGHVASKCGMDHDSFCRSLLKCALLYEFVSPGDLSNSPVRGFELLMSHCRHALMTPLTVHNCTHLLNTLYEYGSVTQQNRVISYISRNLKQVMESEDNAAALATLPPALHSKILFSHFSMLQVLEEQ